MRIVAGKLRAVTHRRVTRTAIDAVGAVHIGQEQGVEKTFFENARQIHPVMDITVTIHGRSKGCFHCPME